MTARAVWGALRSALSSRRTTPEATSSISARMAIMASQKRSSSAFGSDSVGSTMRQPAIGKDMVGAWNP